MPSRMAHVRWLRIRRTRIRGRSHSPRLLIAWQHQVWAETYHGTVARPALRQRDTLAAASHERSTPRGLVVASGPGIDRLLLV
jgi:hypothetical protein